MEKIENLLRKDQKFLDLSNPTITEGKYVPATDIFDEKPFDLFELPSSAMIRDKDRSGIGQEI